MSTSRVVMGLLFFPRGGSAYVARYLSRGLSDFGWEVSLASGSLGAAGVDSNASTFFVGTDVHVVDYTEAMSAFLEGGSAIAARVPMHPSFEDRADAPDVVLASVPPGLADHLSSVWERPFAAADAAGADVLHLHHLTPQFDTVARCWPDVPVLAHLHGTELKFIEAIEARVAVAAALGATLAGMPVLAAEVPDWSAVLDTAHAELAAKTRWDQWVHGEFWAAHLRAQAQLADQLVVVSPPDRATATTLLGVDSERVVVIPNGVDTNRFRPQHLGADQRRAWFRRWLVEEPQGWTETGAPGTVTYRDDDLDRLLGSDGDGVVLLYVGRFTSAKRVPVLIRAFARARDRFERRASLVVWGGSPGEFEDEHPVTVATSVGADGIFFAGWRGHDDLPDALAASDALVMASMNDSYPQAPLEAMAVGLPVIATTSGGFPSMINLDATRPTGWLVAPDDIDRLANALVEAVNQPADRKQRGQHALAHARTHLSWNGLVPRFEDAYTAAVAQHAANR